MPLCDWIAAKRGRAAAMALLVLLITARTGLAQQPFCLPDAPPHDGHPLFGNPEAMLNPFAPVMGL
ncbi:MAG TPA: hypothetical protein VGM03_21570, partial [Phycisphaerae bacterium]